MGVVNYPGGDGEAAKLVLRDKFGSSFSVRHYRHGVTSVDAKWAAQFTGKDLLCVGWCPTAQGILLLAAAVKTLAVVDHHKSSLATLATLGVALPDNVRLCITASRLTGPCASSVHLYRLLNDNKALPDWLRVVGLHEGGVLTSDEDRAVYAALTDDLESMDIFRRCSTAELLERGKYLLEKHRPMVARALISKAEYGTVQVQDGTTYRVAYVDLSHEKFLHETNDAFWKAHTTNAPPVDLLALRIAHPSNNTDFKLLRPPSSQLDLSLFAKLYHPTTTANSSAAFARIRLPHSPKHLHNLTS